MTPSRVWLALGANEGNPAAQCRLALRRLQRVSGVRLVACSHFYRTQPVGYAQQPWFINAACLLHTLLHPMALLNVLQRLERQAGRRPSRRNGPRPLDLDLLLWEGRTLHQKKLTLPHPRMHQRRFVLQPLREIQPMICHPRHGKTVDTLLREVDDSSVVERDMAAIPWWNGDRRKPKI